MTAENDNLSRAIEEIERRQGVQQQPLTHNGRLANQSSTTHFYKTSFNPLDNALNGGWPSGRLSVVSGRPTSGGLTLLLKSVAQAQQQGGEVLLIDFMRTFDPDYALHADVILEQLTVIRPDSRRQGFAIIREAVKANCFALVALDLPEQYLRDVQTADLLVDTLERLWPLLIHSQTALLALVTCWYSDQIEPDPLAYYTAVRLIIRRSEWLYKEGDINGYVCQIIMLKNKMGMLAHTPLTVPITFDQTVKGDRL